MDKSVREILMGRMIIHLKVKGGKVMKFQGALIKEQGQTFAIVVVKPHILQSSAQADDVRSNFRGVFPGVPIILMAQNSRGTPTYYGRNDIVNFLAKLPISAIPWKEYNYN